MALRATFLGCAFLALASVSASAATPAAASSPGPTLPAGLQTHRAIYEMKLKSVRNAATISAASGTMLYEFGDACDGWTTQQRFELNFRDTDGNEVKTDTNYVTWESKDGHDLRFEMRKVANGNVDEELSGTATTGAAGGEVKFGGAEPKTMPLPAGTLFPWAHTFALLDRANAGDKMFYATVFDGASADGPNGISAVIGKPTDKVDADAIAAVPEAQRALVAGKAWPITMAIFPDSAEATEPEQEMTTVFQQNGILRSMVLDFGTFALEGQLKSVEPVKRPDC